MIKGYVIVSLALFITTNIFFIFCYKTFRNNCTMLTGETDLSFGSVLVSHLINNLLFSIVPIANLYLSIRYVKDMLLEEYEYDE